MIRRPHTILAAVLALSSVPAAADGAPAVAEAGNCASGKAIERALGRHGFRVVVAGGYKARGERSVKVQVWENGERDWVITEAFLRERRTCVVRTGIRLHTLY